MIPVGFEGSIFGCVVPAVTGASEEGGKNWDPEAPLPFTGGGWTVVGVEAPPDGGMGMFCMGVGVAEGRACGLYSVVWFGTGKGAADTAEGQLL